jgi:ComF family protein
MAMDAISKLAHQITRLYSNLLPIPCLLCGSHNNNHSLCPDCIDNFPKLGHCCTRCATPLSLTSTCGHCLNHPPEQNLSTSLFAYQNPIDRLIADFKYHDKLYLTELFADLMFEQLKNKPLPQLLIPIPLHRRRLRQRGYNQALELAKILSRKLNIPIGKNILIRSRDTAPQASLPYDQRKHNMRRAFKLNDAVLPNHIVLIDDVLTTGHTVNAAAKLFRQEGVTTIELWTIARTIRHD